MQADDQKMRSGTLGTFDTVPVCGREVTGIGHGQPLEQRMFLGGLSNGRWHNGKVLAGESFSSDVEGGHADGEGAGSS